MGLVSREEDEVYPGGSSFFLEAIEYTLSTLALCASEGRAGRGISWYEGFLLVLEYIETEDDREDDRAGLPDGG